MLSPQEAIGRLLRHVEHSIPAARIGNTSAEPVLWLPAPDGYAVWVAYGKGVYVAWVSRRSGRQRVWHKYIGTDREAAEQLWPRVSSWLNGHRELSEAWEQHRQQMAAARRPAPAPATAVHNAGDENLTANTELLPYEPILGDISPVDGPLETLQIQISAETAAAIRSAVALFELDERTVFETGARMYLSHTEGSLFMTGGMERSIYLRALAEQWGDGSAPADELLTFMVNMAIQTQFGEKIVTAYNETMDE